MFENWSQRQKDRNSNRQKEWNVNGISENGKKKFTFVTQIILLEKNILATERPLKMGKLLKNKMCLINLLLIIWKIIYLIKVSDMYTLVVS